MKVDQEIDENKVTANGESNSQQNMSTFAPRNTNMSTFAPRNTLLVQNNNVTSLFIWLSCHFV
jgi:hypothetical protein